MASDDDRVAAERDALYGLPLDGFIPARDEAARRLRSGGDREAAAEVKQLRKPSVVAWSLNQARRHAPGRIVALLAAAGALREAQEALLGGGGQAALREAAAAERALVQEVAELAEHELKEAGHPASAAVRTKVFETLQAATRDPAVGELLAAGALVRETQVGDLGFGGARAFTAPAAGSKGAAARDARRGIHGEAGCAEVRGRRAEVRGRGAEVRARGAEVWGRRAEGRARRAQAARRGARPPSREGGRAAARRPDP